MIKLLLLALLAFNFTVQAQDLKISEPGNEKVIHLLNNIHLVESTNTEEYSVKIYSIDNGPGSAGFPNCEVSRNLLIAISRFDEVPDQNLFEIGALYNPKFVKWADNTQNTSVNFVIEYGPIDETKTIELSVDLSTLAIVKK